MTSLEPVTFAVRGEASRAASVATSSGVVKRPVGMPAVACSRTAAGPMLDAFSRVVAAEGL